MARQKAWVLTHWNKNGAVYQPALRDNLIAGESLMMVRDFQPNAVPTSQHTLIVEVWAEDTRIALLDGTVHKVLAVEPFDTTGQATGRGLNDSLTALEVTALSTWLGNKTGKTNTQIAAWFGLTPAQLSAWLQANPRREALLKLIDAWYRY